MVLRDCNISVCDLIPETLWQKPKVYIFSKKKSQKIVLGGLVYLENGKS